MNLTFLVGNGFDIANGLPTRYVDFFNGFQHNPDNKLYEIIDNDVEKWSDFEINLGEFTKTDKFKLLYEQNNKNFNTDINEIISNLNDYLIECEDSVNFHESDDFLEKRNDDLMNFTRDLKPIQSQKIDDLIFSSNVTNVNFVNFNFTTLLDKIFDDISDFPVVDNANEKKTIFKIGSVVHPHGEIQLYPLIGVNDESQIEISELDELAKKILIKPVAVENIGNGIVQKIENGINRSDVIYIFGMSLGETDKIWWEKILHWMIEDKKHILIVSNYSPDFSYVNLMDMLVNEGEIKSKLIRYLSDKSNEDIFDNQLFVVNNPSIFEYKKYIQKKKDEISVKD